MILELKNISVKFTSGHSVQAVEDVNMTINQKDKIAIVGETGSGKSILLLAVLHLLPENAEVSGQALFEGEDMLAMKRVTHDLNFAKDISAYICVMYAASQVEYAATEELLNNPLHPYTCDMLAAMPENGLKFKEGFAMSHDDYAVTGCKYAPRCLDCYEKCREMPPWPKLKGTKCAAGNMQNKRLKLRRRTGRMFIQTENLSKNTKAGQKTARPSMLYHLLVWKFMRERRWGF